MVSALMWGRVTFSWGIPYVAVSPSMRFNIFIWYIVPTVETFKLSAIAVLDNPESVAEIHAVVAALVNAG